ncbi:hypothetical protein DFH07DRAFT_970589 [Mycena maculata]|uniref:Uncharacterized protein n=1 Tax=Mycena maculata TaxID=230809 RepID=A0AAD7HS83_9AGAR|nr:hypothetical protein DFH07DRAFT_970589 [Mycena maculata]
MQEHTEHIRSPDILPTNPITKTMSLSTQHGHVSIPRCAATSALAPTVLVGAHPPAVAPGGRLARAFPILAAANGSFTDFPPQHAPNADEVLVHTYASFLEEPASTLSPNTRRGDAWTICIPVDLPKISSPTLLSVNYMIRYATTAEAGNSIIQTDVVLTTASLPAEVVSGSTALDVYRPSAGIPRIVDQATTVCLANTVAIKANAGGLQWSHYVDTQHVIPNVRVHKPTQLYVVFNVEEQSTCQTVRSLSVGISATWQKKEVEIKALAKEKREAAEAAHKAAKELEEKRKREADEQQARDEARQWMAAETRAREAEQVHWEEERRAREANTAAVVAAIAKIANHRSKEAAPAIADAHLQESIVEAMKKLGLPLFSSGYPFEKHEDGYWCTGGTPGGKGTHFISFKDLGMD